MTTSPTKMALQSGPRTDSTSGGRDAGDVIGLTSPRAGRGTPSLAAIRARRSPRASEGLATVLRGSVNAPRLGARLALPDGVFVIFAQMVGYAAAPGG